jgi:hypothetical protein
MRRLVLAFLHLSSASKVSLAKKDEVAGSEIAANAVRPAISQ